VKDTLDDVGITQRQLGYWQKQGLFTPELGETTKFYTEGDTKQLGFLKRLIVDLGLPVATVQRLVSSAQADIEADTDGWLGSVDMRTFIDIANTRLVEPADAMHELVADAMVGAKSWRVERLLQPTMLLALRSAWMRSPNLDVYEAHIKSLHDRLERIDLLSRFQIDADGQVRFWPKRNTDPDLTAEDIERLAKEKRSLESDLHAARSRKYWR